MLDHQTEDETGYHAFGECLAAGEYGEGIIDEHFSTSYIINDASMAEQRRGIDRWYTHRQTGDRASVQYKTDFTAGKTGNAFVETVSVDATQTRGWAYTCCAKYLFYYVPAQNRLYIAKMKRIRDMLETWREQYPTREAKNKEYRGYGVCVPLGVFAHHCITNIHLKWKEHSHARNNA